MKALDIVSYVKPTELACAFPPARGFNGALTTIRDLAQHGLVCANRLFVPTRADAVALILATQYQRAVGRGAGNRAKRRLAKFGIVMTEHGPGRLRADGLLQGPFLCYPTPKAVAPATFREAADYFRARAYHAEELTRYYDSRQYTGD